MTRPKNVLLPAKADEQVAASSRLILAAAQSALADSLQPARDASPRRAIILGGGACREIPLAELTRQFDEIVINDIKATDSQAVVREHGLDAAAAAKIRWRIYDVTGQTSRLAEAWRQSLAASDHPADAIEAMSVVAEGELFSGATAGSSSSVVERNTAPALRDKPAVAPETTPGGSIVPSSEKFQLVIASCLLSQLHTPAWQTARDQFAAKFPKATRELAESKRWLTALDKLARALERDFINQLASLVAPAGRIYLSESVRVSYLNWAGPDQWSARGGLRMTATGDLADYLDARFEIEARDRWAWIFPPCEPPGQQGKAFEVQGLILRPAPAGE